MKQLTIRKDELIAIVDIEQNVLVANPRPDKIQALRDDDASLWYRYAVIDKTTKKVKRLLPN